MLAARNITWRQGENIILDGIDFDLYKGERVGVIGPNGSGKSSLLKILSFLQPPTSGQLTFQGKSLAGPVPLVIRRRISVVFQEALLFNTSVFDNVAAGLQIRGVPKQTIKKQVEHWLEQFGISHLINKPARLLSGGEAQRVSLARAFVVQPDILFLDEPFSALDLPTKQSLIAELLTIVKSTRPTMVLISHDFGEILRLTERAVVLMDGRIAAEASPRELLSVSEPQHVADFLSHWRSVFPLMH